MWYEHPCKVSSKVIQPKIIYGSSKSTPFHRSSQDTNQLLLSIESMKQTSNQDCTKLSTRFSLIPTERLNAPQNFNHKHSHAPSVFMNHWIATISHLWSVDGFKCIGFVIMETAHWLSCSTAKLWVRISLKMHSVIIWCGMNTPAKFHQKLSSQK